MPPPPPWLLLMAVLVVVGVLEPMKGEAAAECKGEGEGGTEERLPVLGLGLEESEGEGRKLAVKNKRRLKRLPERLWK